MLSNCGIVMCTMYKIIVSGGHGFFVAGFAGAEESPIYLIS